MNTKSRKRQEPAIKIDFEHFKTKSCVNISFSKKTLLKWLAEIDKREKQKAKAAEATR